MTMFVIGTSTNNAPALAEGDQVFVGAGVTVGATSGPALQGTGGGHYVDIEGSVVGSVVAVLMGNTAGQLGQRMLVGHDGYVSAATNFAVVLGGHDTVLDNRGTIYGFNGVDIEADAATGVSRLINSGVIEAFGDTAVNYIGTQAMTFGNGGTIISANNAFKGLGSGAETIVNTGHITGTVTFGGGNDVYSGASGRLAGHLLGNFGNDVMIGGIDNDWFEGGTENDALAGNGGSDRLIGDDGADTLNGGLGSDILNGGFGNDTLFGGAGNDNLTGGAGNDFFVFNTALNASTNRDVITDFNHVADTLRLENAIFTKLGAGVHALNPAFFHAGAAAADTNDFIVYNQATGLLSYDVNGNAAGGATAFAVLTNHPVLAANDFAVI